MHDVTNVNLQLFTPLFYFSAKPQWEFMHGLMENAIYGGRVDNTFDMRVLISYLEQCFNDTAITGQSATPTRTGKKVLALPFGNIPVSLRTQVSMLYVCMWNGLGTRLELILA